MRCRPAAFVETVVPRLKALRSTVGALSPMVAAPPKVADPFYRSEQWRALRKEKRAQGPAFCCVCGASGKLILDHRDERRDGGLDLPPLEALDWYCVGHHNAKTAAARAARVRP